VTIIAGFRCQGGVVLCSDTQETSGDAKRNVTKLQCFQGPVVGQDGHGMVNADLALAICGAGYGPFIDKITSQAWDAVRHVSDIWEASERVESMIKETYQEFGQIYQTGACPQVNLIYGITKGGDSRLFQAIGPVVNETYYASDGIGYYLANFLTTRMRGDGWLTIRQTIILAAYILFQTKEHVEGCGGDSHIAVLRESESSGMVDFRLIQHLTEYLKSADHYTGEMLLTAADFSISDSDASDGISNSVDMLKFLRSEEIKRLEEHRESDRSPLYGLGGFKREEDDLGLPTMDRQSGSQTSENEAGNEEG
jgi:hypothetical protein